MKVNPAAVQEHQKIIANIWRHTLTRLY